MPQTSAAVVGVHNGTLFPTLNYFPNIIHPIEDFSSYSFKVYEIKHKNQNPDPPNTKSVEDGSKELSGSTSIDFGKIEDGPAALPRRRSTFRRLTQTLTGSPDKKKPRVPAQWFSPLNVLSVGSCLLTIGLLVWAALIKDGTACCALGTISLASSIVGYASWWSPVLSLRNFSSKVPAGDVVVRTREGAFILVRCNEEVARELYTGTEECRYYVGIQMYRVLVGLGTFLLMVSVVLLGNCNFTMQAAIGVSYIVLNGAFWIASLIPKGRFWDLSNYVWTDITPSDARNAHEKQGDTLEGKPSFTRTMWYAIRETKKTGWVKRMGAAPATPKWEEWLKLAELNASRGNRKWNAVEKREEIVGESDSIPQAKAAAHRDTAEEHAPAFEVPLDTTR